MQRDTHLTFREIHGTAEAMLTSIERIQNVALCRATEGYPCIRYLSRISHGPNFHDMTGNVYLQLEPLDPAWEDYVTVSYTWERTDPVPTNIPQYSILGSGEVVNLPMELNYVLHRAWEFADSKKIDVLWIDQLCIVQNDPEDIERHLRWMHEVYTYSRYTFVPLCSSISDESMLQTLDSFLFGKLGIPDSAETVVEKVYKLLGFITRDRWFQRTWTFQERFCGTDVHLTIHLTSQDAKEIQEQDLQPDRIVRIDDIRAAFSNFKDAAQRWSQGTSFSRLQHMMHVKFDDSSSVSTSDGLYGALQRTEICDNSIVSDRVAIVGNVAGLKWILKSRPLNDSLFSYSTCLLILLFANERSDLRRLPRRYFWIRMDATVPDIFRTLVHHRSKYLTSPPKIKAVYPLHISDDPNTPTDGSYVSIPIWTDEDLRKMIMGSADAH